MGLTASPLLWLNVLALESYEGHWEWTGAVGANPPTVPPL